MARHRRKRDLSEYRAMWLFVMFDLPVDTPAAKKDYVRFRKLLQANGFMMVQYSIYVRYFGSEESSHSHRKRIRAGLPSGGQVRLLMVTDHQFGKMEVFHGKKRGDPEKQPEQLLLF